MTSVTRELLEHWHDRAARQYPFYFCQLEAIETLIWWVEGAAEYKQGIDDPRRRRAVGAAVQQDGHRRGQDHGDGDDHHLAGAERADLSEAQQGFLAAPSSSWRPGLTVKERLQVLLPGEPDNYYDEFDLCPSEALRQKLNQAEVLIENWHTLMPLKEPDRSVVKKGTESDEAFTRRVLGKLAGHKDIVVINDEAHHAYRMPRRGQDQQEGGGRAGHRPG